MANKKDLIIEYILNRIQNKLYSPGQMIASEADFCRMFQVSRMTVRKAFDELVAEGTLYKEKGRGTFVSQKPRYSEFQCGFGFKQEALRRGFIPSTKNAEIALIKADQNLAAKLQIKKDDSLWEVKRIRCINDKPVIYVHEYYIHAQCDDLTIAIANESIYDHLAEKGISFAFGDQRMEAVLCPRDIAVALHISPKHPVILMSVLAYMKNGTPFNYGLEYYVSDQLPLIQSVYNKNNHSLTD